MYLKKLLQFFNYLRNRKDSSDETWITNYFEQQENEDEIAEVNEDNWTNEQHDRIYNNIQVRTLVKQRQIVQKRVLLKVAATVVLLIVGSIVSYSIIQSYNLFGRWGTTREFVAKRGEIKMITLTDGTNIWLNSGGRLACVENKKERRVQLSGEAYFQVAGKVHKPFLVQAGDVLVNVLGTSFNVRAHSSEPVIQVSVASGRVSVADMHVPGKGRSPVHLESDERVTYHSDKESFDHIEHMETLDFTDWRTGIMHYEATPLRMILGDIERKYRVKIAANEALLDCPITVRFDHFKLTKILSILTSIMEGDLTYEAGTYKLTGKRCN